MRVVATDLSTTVAWLTANYATSGSQVITRGRFVQIFNPLASQPMKVDCDKPCLVMLYNTGAYLQQIKWVSHRFSFLFSRPGGAVLNPFPVYSAMRF